MQGIRDAPDGPAEPIVHRKACHACGNIRKTRLECSSCPQTYCQRCVERQGGLAVFNGSCPNCRQECCCFLPKTATVCYRRAHCYRRCPAPGAGFGDSALVASFGAPAVDEVGQDVAAPAVSTAMDAAEGEAAEGGYGQWATGGPATGSYAALAPSYTAQHPADRSHADTERSYQSDVRSAQAAAIPHTSGTSVQRTRSGHARRMAGGQRAGHGGQSEHEANQGPAYPTAAADRLMTHECGPAHGQPLQAGLPQAAGPKRVSCHKCGNMRSKVVSCPACPHVFCGRCSVRLLVEFGPSLFTDGCPVCKSLCCCSGEGTAAGAGSGRGTLSCPLQNHCYKRCALAQVKSRSLSAAPKVARKGGRRAGATDGAQATDGQPTDAQGVEEAEGQADEDAMDVDEQPSVSTASCGRMPSIPMSRPAMSEGQAEAVVQGLLVPTATLKAAGAHSAGGLQGATAPSAPAYAHPEATASEDQLMPPTGRYLHLPHMPPGYNALAGAPVRSGRKLKRQPSSSYEYTEADSRYRRGSLVVDGAQAGARPLSGAGGLASRLRSNGVDAPMPSDIAAAGLPSAKSPYDDSRWAVVASGEPHGVGHGLVDGHGHAGKARRKGSRGSREKPRGQGQQPQPTATAAPWKASPAVGWAPVQPRVRAIVPPTSTGPDDGRTRLESPGGGIDTRLVPLIPGLTRSRSSSFTSDGDSLDGCDATADVPTMDGRGAQPARVGLGRGWNMPGTAALAYGGSMMTPIRHSTSDGGPRQPSTSRDASTVTSSPWTGLGLPGLGPAGGGASSGLPLAGTGPALGPREREGFLKASSLAGLGHGPGPALATAGHVLAPDGHGPPSPTPSPSIAVQTSQGLVVVPTSLGLAMPSVPVAGAPGSTGASHHGLSSHVSLRRSHGSESSLSSLAGFMGEANEATGREEAGHDRAVFEPAQPFKRRAKALKLQPGPRPSPNLQPAGASAGSPWRATLGLLPGLSPASGAVLTPSVGAAAAALTGIHSHMAGGATGLSPAGAVARVPSNTAASQGGRPAAVPSAIPSRVFNDFR